VFTNTHNICFDYIHLNIGSLISIYDSKKAAVLAAAFVILIF